MGVGARSTLALYNAFKDVDRQQASLLSALVMVSVATGAINLVNDLALLLLWAAGTRSPH